MTVTMWITTTSRASARDEPVLAATAVSHPWRHDTSGCLEHSAGLPLGDPGTKRHLVSPWPRVVYLIP